MKYPIASVITPDKIKLFGFLEEASKGEAILINIHGTASAFYVEEFEGEFIERLPNLGVSVLFTNNRGNHTMESWQETGAAVEKFEDCLIDIDTWIEFALSKGYSKIILQGHSLGTEKVVYYMEKGKYKNKVVGVILLGFADSYGWQMRFLKTQTINPMIEAKEKVKNGKGHELLNNIWNSHAGVLPMNANAYIDFFSENSELSKALPLRKGKDLTFYQNIKVPILGVISATDQWLLSPINETVNMMKSENKNAQIETIGNTDHSFSGKQKELVDIVENFVSRFH